MLTDKPFPEKKDIPVLLENLARDTYCIADLIELHHSPDHIIRLELIEIPPALIKAAEKLKSDNND